MSGLRDKLDAVDEYLGEWVKVAEGRYINLLGYILFYNKKTNRLVLDDITIYLDENGSATLGSKIIAFEHLRGSTYHLTKRPLTKNKRQ